MSRAAMMILVLWLAGCSPKPDPDVATLKAKVATLEKQVILLTQQSVPIASAPNPAVPSASGSATAPPKFELVVSWADKGGNDYRHLYQSADACEAGRQVIFAENSRRSAAARANLPPGAIMLSGPVEPSAVCLPT